MDLNFVKSFIKLNEDFHIEFRKVFYSCNCAYDIDHNNAYASRNARCSCGMSLLQIMNFSRASNY